MSSFPTSHLRFLADLAEHNDRLWFEAHKAEYRATYAEFQERALDLVTAVSGFDEQVFAQPDYYKVFRIYRDVRFSKDKTPYKEHYSLEIVRGGRDTGREFYYFRLKPNGGSLVGGGWFPQDSRELFAMRKYVSRHLAIFESVLSKLRQDGFNLDDPAGKLKGVPRGFPKDDPALEYLRYKAFALVRPLPDETVLRTDILALAGDYFARARPFLDFFTRARQEIARDRDSYVVG